ncbi:GGDEF domain-containing protein [Pelomonas aquatica]|jgi:diguanylate cyclase (GGDEF)-like protein|uniref:diguanylate cyclase n=1 Tax=Pelomonas aquatica TaxID=431058 RepID=A0A9X4LJE7_9BURK|nr:diguanylate cyclase [Pelomonas aquatica]MCY4752867.1 diguanylate cyclase [Pelomonas aquatica]MDG0864303.1 GGDEF domain-containing protein [Pelomonas aquatica]
MAMSSIRRLGDLWLGTEPTLRLRLRQTSLAMALMCLSIPLLHYAVDLANDGGRPLLWAWTAVSLGGMALVYAAIRSGWSLRLADPSLTVVQIAFAIAAAATGYAQAGPLRGAVFPVLTLILMFGMFQLRARGAYVLSLFALTLFGMVMAYMAGRRPAAYPPAVEIGHFLMLACMLPAIATLTARLSRIRRRLSDQREELARALAQLQAIATRDELTGLPNRRQMQALMDQELLRSQRHSHDFCVAILDLDHFKRVNDEHGHAAGDEVLRAFARTGQAALRATDVLARWGGEEFLVLLPDTSMPPALAGMERLRQHIAALRTDVGDGASVMVTVSIGLTGHRRGDPLAETLERADRLLYQAKSEGRDRICIG